MIKKFDEYQINEASGNQLALIKGIEESAAKLINGIYSLSNSLKAGDKAKELLISEKFLNSLPDEYSDFSKILKQVKKELQK